MRKSIQAGLVTDVVEVTEDILAEKPKHSCLAGIPHWRKHPLSCPRMDDNGECQGFNLKCWLCHQGCT